MEENKEKNNKKSLPEPTNLICKNFDQLKILKEFENLDHKLENVHQKIENEIQKKINVNEKNEKKTQISPEISFEEKQVKTEKNQQPKSDFVNIADYTSFSCISENIFNNRGKESEYEKNEINNTFQIENIDYDEFKTSLEKEFQEKEDNNQSGNLNFDQISDIE